ncbi:MAG TPA: hypothetical protein VEU09_09720, partial [Candidatus Binatia bacterium]|nr:hypothetical protein [Candidatus Binatia bacterium]
MLAAAALALMAGCAGSRRPPELPPARTAPAPAPTSDPWRSTTSIRVGLAVGAPRLTIAGSRPWTLRLLGGKSIVQGASGDRIAVVRDGAGAIDVFREGEPEPVWTGGV